MAEQPDSERLQAEANPFSQSQRATDEAVKQRQGEQARSQGASPRSPASQQDASTGTDARRDGDPFDQSDRATDEAVAERAAQSPSRLNEDDA